MKVEFFRLFANHTWDTVVAELPPIAEELAKGATMLEGYNCWDDVGDRDFDEWVEQFIHEGDLTWAWRSGACHIGVYRKDVQEESDAKTE